MSRRGKLTGRLACLQPATSPIAQVLVQLRDLLLTAYEEAEKDISVIGFHVAGTLHEEYRLCFKYLEEQLHGQDISLQPVDDSIKSLEALLSDMSDEGTD